MRGLGRAQRLHIADATVELLRAGIGREIGQKLQAAALSTLAGLSRALAPRRSDIYCPIIVIDTARARPPVILYISNI